MSNPFDKFDENPFADAAVLEAAEYGEVEEPEPEPAKKGKEGKKGKKDKEKEGLFSGPSSSSPAPPASASSFPPPPSSSPPPSASPPSYSESASNEALRKKEEELRRKEAELAAKQRQMEHQQQQAQLPPGARAPNWPPFRPWIYHSIADEIPPDHQRLMTFMYRSWFLTILALAVNLIGCLCILIAGIGGQDFGFSIMYMVAIPPLAFGLWYRPVYNALMKDNSFYFFTFLVFGMCHILFMLYLVMGGPETGAAGFINMIDLFAKKHYGEGAICLIALIFLIMTSAVHIYLWRQVYTIYRFRGHSFQSARNQAFTSAATSDVGRQAISTAVVGAAQGFAQGSTQGPK